MHIAFKVTACNVDWEMLKELLRISDRNGPLRTGADRFGATGDDSGQKRTIRDNYYKYNKERELLNGADGLSLGFVSIGT
jgi:hypothetical protein